MNNSTLTDLPRLRFAEVLRLSPCYKSCSPPKTIRTPRTLQGFSKTSPAKESEFHLGLLPPQHNPLKVTPYHNSPCLVCKTERHLHLSQFSFCQDLLLSQTHTRTHTLVGICEAVILVEYLFLFFEAAKQLHQPFFNPFPRFAAKYAFVSSCRAWQKSLYWPLFSFCSFYNVRFCSTLRVLSTEK